MNEQETTQFRATSGDFQGFGRTPQEALNALLAHFSGDAPTPIVIWPYNREDALFYAAQLVQFANQWSNGGSSARAATVLLPL